MNTEIEVYAAAPLPDRWNYAMAMASAGELVPKGMRTNGQPDAGKIFFTFETGSMLGIHPVAAIQGVNVIDGKPTLSPELMTAVIRRAGHKIRVTVTGQMADLSLTATAQLIRSDDPDFTFESVWTIGKAQQAGLLTVVDGRVVAKVGRNQEAGVWEKYTAAMLKARALGEVCREGGTDALMGISYMPEELGAPVNEAGELIVLEGADGPQPEFQGRRPAPSAEDYRPIALADTPAAPVAEATSDEELAELVARYQLDRISSVIEARQAYMAVRTDGNLDRMIEGVTLRQWLTSLARELEQIQERVDQQTGEVYEGAKAEAVPA